VFTVNSIIVDLGEKSANP